VAKDKGTDDKHAVNKVASVFQTPRGLVYDGDGGIIIFGRILEEFPRLLTLEEFWKNFDSKKTIIRQLSDN
jgi:hypothetical protein